MSELIEGRNAVLEAFRSGKCVDKLFILDGCQDGPVRTIAREARKKIRSLIMFLRNVLTSLVRQRRTRELSLRWLPMNMLQ